MPQSPFSCVARINSLDAKYYYRSKIIAFRIIIPIIAVLNALLTVFGLTFNAK